MTIEELKHLKESEDKVEFKEAQHNFPWNGGSHTEQKERRKCYLGYIVALANEGGGLLVFGMADKPPHDVVGSNFGEGKIGELEDAVYGKLGIRVHLEELFDASGLRVLLTSIPSRPLGRTLKFEGVPLMRTGDSLRNMSDEEVFKILSEQEPDFSAKICNGFSFEDIDETAIETLKKKYAQKQNNPTFSTLQNEQALSDLNLVTQGGLTFAALLLVGKETAIKKYLPNAQINIEYRQNLNQIHFDKRETFIKPLFLAIDDVWNMLNARNRDNKINEGPYKFDLPYFNQEVIREAILNAIGHRDYSINSETVIKQYPDRISILNPGGFPKGVTKENLITISSTPRSRLLTEILEKTGLVERSGQGVDKIYRITISEGKPLPDYSKTDFFQVELTLLGEVSDKAFAAFIGNEQSKRDKDNQLGTFEILGLYRIKEGSSESVDSHILEALDKVKLIKRTGGSASEKYVLSDSYFELKDKPAEIGGFRMIDLERIMDLFKEKQQVKMGDLVSAFETDLNRAQVKYLIDKLTGMILTKEGSGKGTYYELVHEVQDIDELKSILK
jgi:ATP-dependent DNA helicase RecG